MALHAIENIGDAFSVTRAFLFPFELRHWVKLALVTLFIGGGMGLPSVQTNSPRGVEPIPEEIPAMLPENAPQIAALVVGAIVVLGLIFSLVGAIMEFVFVESLRTGNVSIRRHWSRRWRQGFRLFGFRLALGLPLFALVIGWVGLLVVPEIVPDVDPIVPFGTLLFVGIPLVFLLGVLYALVASFTTVFVVPIMIKIDGGVLAGWRLLWGSIKAAPRQYLVYAVVALVLTFATGIAASIVVGIAAVALLIPLVVFGAIVYFTVSLSSTVGLVALAATGALFLAAILALGLVVQVPVLAYLRYYALLVLGDIDASLDLIPDRRAVVRGRSEPSVSDAF